MSSLKRSQRNQSELDMVLLQSPERVERCQGAHQSDLDKLDTEILITGESNEYEIEEYPIFEQGADERKLYQCLMKDGHLLSKDCISKGESKVFSRTSIKNSANSLSVKSTPGYYSQTMRKSKQRSSYLLKMKVKEISKKMNPSSGSKENPKSRNLQGQGWTKLSVSKQGELESIPEFNNKLKRKYLSTKSKF